MVITVMVHVSFSCQTYRNLPTTLWDKYYYTHFTDEETEAAILGLSQMPLGGPPAGYLFGTARGRTAGGAAGWAWHRQSPSLFLRRLKQLSL